MKLSKKDGRMPTETYTADFWVEAIKLVLAQGLSLEEIAQRTVMPKDTFANWVSSAWRGNAGTVMPGSLTDSEFEARVVRLRRDLAETRMERDVIKKAAAYFARESLTGTRSWIHCDSTTRWHCCAVLSVCQAVDSMPGSIVHLRRARMRASA